jgi:hypothetical protein
VVRLRERARHPAWELRVTARWLALDAPVHVAAWRWADDGDLQAVLISDPAVREDPVAVFERLRAAGPISPTRIGHISPSHRIVQTVLRSDEFHTTRVQTGLPRPLRLIERWTRGGHLHPLQPPSLLSVDPPEHSRYRALVSSVFTARAVAALRPQVQAVADELLDEAEAAGPDGAPVDIVPRYCARLPVAVISEILGVPPEDRGRVLEFGELAAASLDVGLSLDTFRDVERGLCDFDAWLSEHLAQLRRNPGDDLMSQLAHASIDGQQLDHDELRATAGLVLVAGFETTVNLLGNGMKLLLDHPDQLAVLAADPARWPNAVEEVLRTESPVLATARLAARDTTVEGYPVAEGEVVTLLLAAANRDPELFTDPNSFDVTRSNAGKHLAFSAGRHYCLGAALARLEGEIGLRTVFERFPRLRLAGPAARRPTRVLRGWAHLPVQLAPVPAADVDRALPRRS